MAFKLELFADVKALLRGTGDVADALEDTADVLDDLARGAGKAGDKVGDALTDAGKTGEKAADKLERKFRDALDEVKTSSKRAGDDLGDNIRRGTDKASDGVEDFKSESASTARETAASFDGSADSIAGSFQEVAANAFAGFGPAGAAAGLLIAAGLGVGMSMFTETTEAGKARISDLADAMIEANQRVLSEDFINDQLRRIYTNADDAAISVDNLREAAEETGLSESEMARAFAGDQDARVRALEAVRGKYAEAMTDSQSLDNDVAASGVRRVDELGRWMGDLERLGGEYDTAASRQRGYTDAIAAGESRSREQVGETRKAYEDLHRVVGSRPTPTPIRVPVTGDFTEVDRQVRNYKPVITASIRTGTAAV